jgi:hypothetical protein
VKEERARSILNYEENTYKYCFQTKLVTCNRRLQKQLQQALFFAYYLSHPRFMYNKVTMHVIEHIFVKYDLFRLKIAVLQRVQYNMCQVEFSILVFICTKRNVLFFIQDLRNLTFFFFQGSVSRPGSSISYSSCSTPLPPTQEVIDRDVEAVLSSLMDLAE